jgi:L,D-transpeptidase YcbB
MNSLKLFLITLIVGCFFTISCIKEPIPMVINSSDTLVQKFYARNHNSLFWFSTNKKSKKAAEWIKEIEAAHRFGIVSDQTKIDLIKSTLHRNSWIDNLLKEHTDQQVTGLVLHYLKELQEGNIRFDYDEVKGSRDSVYITQLLRTKAKGSVSEFVAKLECNDREYQVLKKYLNDSITPNDTLKYKAVIRAMNYRRYIAVSDQPEYVVVNIPEAMARYYYNHSLSLEMRAVVGRKRTPTPTIASYITTIVTFPHWNVPHSIAVKEILPKVQKNEIYLEQNSLMVVNANGIEVEEFELDWMEYTERNFPYFFRQSTGSRNALGVLKFDLQNPFSIYLHSTNSKNGFLRDDRFLSHGCIRLEKPIDLAEKILRGELDIEELKDGKKNTLSEMIELPIKIPVYIIYSPAIVVNSKVTFLPDVYGLIK